MAVTLNTLSTIDTSSGSPQATHSGTFTLAAGIEILSLCIGTARASGAASFTCTALTITDGSGNVLTLTPNLYQRSEVVGSVGWIAAIATGLTSQASPSALVAGTCTVSVTFSVSVSIAGADMFVFQLDSGTSASNPYKGMAGSGIFSATAIDPFDAFPSLSLETGGFAIVFSIRDNGTMGTLTTDSDGAWTQAPDDTSFGSLRGNVQYKAVTSNYSATPQLNPGVAAASNIGLFYWIKEVNDPALTGVTTTPLEPGETITIAGTALDVANTGTRIRKVGGTNAYDNLASFNDSSSTAATDVITNRPARTPYTSEDGTTHTIEFIATLSGVVSGAPTAAITTNDFVPPSGFSRVTIVTPDLTNQSLLSYLGWTSVAGDQIEWDNTVSVDGTSVTITVNSDGTVSADSGGSAMPASVPFYWRAYSTASEQWTGSASNQSDWATATFGAAGTASGRLSMSALRRRRRT
jgi:hypothetical protein